MIERPVWRLLGALPPTLTCLCVLGIVGMFALQSRADSAREYDCLHDRDAAHWSHGYGAWLPIGVLAVAILAVILAVVVFASGRRSPLLARLFCGLASPLAVGAILLAGLLTHDYFAYPGGDISTVSSGPCGAG